HQHKITPKGRIRKSDSAPYINHPVSMAEKILAIHLSRPGGRPPRTLAICAILLHDVPEDVPISLSPADSKAGNTTREAWRQLIAREFNDDGEGVVISEIIDAVTERDIPADQRRGIRKTPLHKVILAFVQRGGMARPRRNAIPLTEKQLAT